MSIFGEGVSVVIQWIINILYVAIPVLFFFMVKTFGLRNKYKVSLSLEERKKATVLSEDRRSSEERTVQFLSMYGVNYRRHRVVSPQEFRNSRILFALIGFMCGLVVIISTGYAALIMLAVALAVLGYYLPVIYYSLENADDNKKMLRDIHSAYDTLRVYLAVDAFITDALDECYRRVGNKRFKAALYELKEGLKIQSEQSYELESFRMKFKNPYIDQLSMTITQYFRSGDVSAMIDDLSEQMVAVDHAINIRQKEKLEASAMLKQCLVIIGLLGGIFVALFINLSSLMTEF